MPLVLLPPFILVCPCLQNTNKGIPQKQQTHLSTQNKTQTVVIMPEHNNPEIGTFELDALVSINKLIHNNKPQNNNPSTPSKKAKTTPH